MPETTLKPEQLAAMTSEELQGHIDSLEDYATRTFWGHSQIRANINAYKAELERREA